MLHQGTRLLMLPVQPRWAENAECETMRMFLLVASSTRCAVLPASRLRRSQEERR